MNIAIETLELTENHQVYNETYHDQWSLIGCISSGIRYVREVESLVTFAHLARNT